MNTSTLERATTHTVARERRSPAPTHVTARVHRRTSLAEVVRLAFVAGRAARCADAGAGAAAASRFAESIRV